jgi:hypothetical protein
MSGAAMTHSFDQQAHAEPAPITAPLQQQLPSGLREDFAAHFGADFDDIGIAPTAVAPAMTANGAGALTVGDDIAFGDTAYQPESGWGRELIAHELAHVVQQRGSTGVPSDALAHLGGRSGPGYSIGRPPAVQRVLDDRSPGRPLEATLREGLHSDFDFSEVRVHADDSAAALAAGVGADAFTRGTDIYFGAGLYQPNSSTGEKLLRHELTHVLQQASGEVSEFAGLVVPPEHPSEARVRPHSALGGRALAPGARDSRIQRQAIQRQPSVTGHMATDAPPASRSMTKDWVEKIRETLNYDVTGLEPSIEELQAFNRMADVDHDHEITLGELVNALDGTEKMTARAWFARAVFFRDYRMDRNLQKLSGEFDRNEFARRARENARVFEANENSLQAGPEGYWTNREGRAATKRELDRYRDPRRLLPLAAVAAAVIFPEAVAVTSAWDTGVKTEETITGKRSGVRVWDIMTGNIGVAGTEMTDSERAAAGTDAALGWAAIGMDGMLAAMRRSPVQGIVSAQRASRAEALGRHFENSRGLRLSDDVTLFRSLPPEARLARNANPDLTVLEGPVTPAVLPTSVTDLTVLEGPVTPVALPTNPAPPGSERLAPTLGPDYFSPGDYAVVPYEATATSRSLQRVIDGGLPPRSGLVAYASSGDGGLSGGGGRSSGTPQIPSDLATSRPGQPMTQGTSGTPTPKVAPSVPEPKPSAPLSAVETMDAMQGHVIAQNSRIATAIRAGDKKFFQNLGLSNKQIQILMNPRRRTFAAQYGNAMERAVGRAMKSDPKLGGVVFDARNTTGTIFPIRPPGQGRPLRPDFGITGGELKGSIVDLTTKGGAAAKMGKYHDRVITLEYDRPKF